METGLLARPGFGVGRGRESVEDPSSEWSRRRAEKKGAPLLLLNSFFSPLRKKVGKKGIKGSVYCTGHKTSIVTLDEESSTIGHEERRLSFDHFLLSSYSALSHPRAHPPLPQHRVPYLICSYLIRPNPGQHITRPSTPRFPIPLLPNQ